MGKYFVLAVNLLGLTVAVTIPWTRKLLPIRALKLTTDLQLEPESGHKPDRVREKS